jgi:hypothetical protein
MVTETSSRRRLFPAVCIQLRTATRSTQIVLSPTAQASALLVAVGVTVALVYLAISQIGYVRLVDDQELAAARAQTTNVGLQDDVARLRDSLAVTTRDRAAADDRVLALASQADALRGQLELTEMRLHGLEQKLSAGETPPPEQATEAGSVEPMRSEPTPPEVNTAQPEVNARDTSAKTKRDAEDIAELGRRAIGEFKSVLCFCRG